MSSGGQIVGGIIGAVIGFYVGGPVGALQGAALGAGIGGYLDPPKGPTVSGPRLTDLAVQTSTYGAHIPRVYGTIGIHGNILWLENNKLKETVRKEKQGGKGGGGGNTTVKTYSYSATFALGLCEGPIVGVRRIWCQDKLIYNAGSDDLGTLIASNKNAKGWNVYLGTDDQEPDARYQADVGVANASAFRGMAYIVFYDFELADYSNTLQAAQFKVEIVTAESGMSGRFAGRYARTETYSGRRNGVYYENTDISAIAVAPISAVTVFDLVGNDLIEEYTFSNGFVAANAAATSENGGPFSWKITSGETTIYELTTAKYQMQVGFALIFASIRNGFMYASGLVSGVRTIYKLQESSLATPYSELASLTLTSSQRPCVMGDKVFIFSFSSSTVSVDVYDDDLVLDYSFSFASARSPLSDEALAYSVGSKFYFPGSSVNNKLLIYDRETQSVADIDIDYNGTVGYLWSMRIDGALLRVTSSYNESAAMHFVNLRGAIDGVPLSDIVGSEMERTGLLSSSDYDVAALTSAVTGYRVLGGSIRAAIEPLQGAFPFDVIQSGYDVKCVPRGQSSVATIQHSELIAEGSEDAFKQAREMDSQLPVRTNIKYLDSAREYSVSEQYSERLNTKAINRVDRDLPLVLTANQAAGVAEVLNYLPWQERAEASFKLPPEYLDLQPADVITLVMEDATHELRLTEVNYSQSGVLDCKARPNRAALYTSTATGGEGTAPDGTIGLAGPSKAQLLDIPVVDETIQNAVGITAAMTGYTGGWPGGVLFRSTDDGQTWTDLKAFIGKCTFGTAGAAIPARSGALLDRGSSLVVTLISGTLESITESQMLNGANYAAYGAPGRWEIMRFQNATLNADGTYTLTVLRRGDKGTEQYTGTHQTGDTFVLLDDPDNAFIGYPSALIGVALNYRAITAGASIDSDTNEAYTYAGVNLKCLSGVHPKGRRNTGLDLTITWVRRTRVGGEWRDSVDASLGEATESYEVDILNGSTVVRTISATTPSVTYTAAQQTTDFGAAQASVLVRIYQLSSVIGRGYPLEATL